MFASAVNLFLKKSLISILFSFLGLITSAHAESYKVACYYYDGTNPYVTEILPQTLSGISWVQASVNNQPFSLEGELKAGFVVPYPSSLTYDGLATLCKSSIPGNTQLFRMAAYPTTTYFSGLRPTEYPMSFESPAHAANGIKRLVVFGDSLSDSLGNVSRILRLVSPIGRKPYWNGHFSNGPLWDRYLAEFLGNMPVDNWSYGGATNTKSNSAQTILEKGIALTRGWVTGNIKSVIEKYENNNMSKPADVAENLYFLWTGANNLRDQQELYKSSEEERQKKSRRYAKQYTKHYATQLVQESKSMIESLCSKGLKNLVVFNVPDLSQMPGLDAEIRARYKYAVRIHNRELQRMVEGLSGSGKCSGANISLFDVNSVLKSILESSLYETDKPCVETYQSGLEELEKLLKTTRNILFFDPVHPTTKFHCLIAAKLLEHLQNHVLTEREPIDIERAFNTCDEKFDEFVNQAKKPHELPSQKRIPYTRNGQKFSFVIDPEGVWNTSIDFSQAGRIQFYADEAQTVARQLLMGGERPVETGRSSGYVKFKFTGEREQVSVRVSDLPRFLGLWDL